MADLLGIKAPNLLCLAECCMGLWNTLDMLLGPAWCWAEQHHVAWSCLVLSAGS